MRGTVAKRLRRLSGVAKQTQANRQYQEIPQTVRNRVVKNLANEIVAQVRTATLELVPSQRSTYKVLKSAL